MFTSTTEEDSDDSVYKTGQKSRHLRISSSSSESDDSVIATNSRRKNNRVSSSSSESDDSSFGSPVRKKCKVLQMSDSETSETADSDVEINRTSTQRRNRRALSSDLEESYNKVPALRETTPQAEAGSSDSDDGERCIICFKTLRPPFAHPSNCTHKFHPICLSTWSKTSNTCPIDRVKYTSIHKVSHQGDLISQERVTTPPPQDHNADFEPDQATFCEVCSQHDREHEMLLCDRCEAGYHLDCLTPPLREVPEGSWFCPSCTDFGNELAEEVSGLMDDAAVILETRMRRRTGVQPRVPRGPRTRGAQRVFDIIHRQATMNQPSTSSSVTVRRRQTSRRTRKSKSRRKPRSTHYKVELITVEDGTTLEVKVAVNTRSKARRYSKRSSKKKCSKVSRKNGNAAKPSNASISTSRDGPSHSLDLFGNRPQLDYFSSCEAEDELDEDGGGGLGLMHRSAVRTNIRSMASRKQIAAQIFNSRPRRPLPKIEASQAPIDLVSSIIQQQEKWLNSNASDYKLTSNGDIKEIIRDTKGTKLKQTAGGYSTSGNAGSTSSATASACETRRDVTTSGGGTSNGGGSSESASFHPLQPPPEPPSKLYEDDDFDLYADIEPPNSSKLAPPPEPPALLFALDGDDKDEVGGGSSPEDAGLVIDDRHDTYDPEMPTSPPSPPSPPPSKTSMADNSKQSDAGNSSAPCFVVALEDIPPPPTPPDEGSESECPNQGIYSKMSLEIAQGKGRADSSDDQVDEEGAVILDKEENANHEDEALSKSGKLSDDEGKEEEEVELDLDKGKDSEMGDDVSSTNNEDNDKKDDDDEGDELDGGNQSDDGTEVISPEKNKTESEKMSDNEDKEAKGEEDFANANGPDGADLKFSDKSSLNKSVEKDSEQEGEVLELGCEEERDGLVDITDEEMSNYERSWEMEDNTSKATKTAGLEGLETEAISDCEYPPVETELTENQNEVEKAVESEPKAKILENGNKEEEGEILAEEQRVPVQWKKLSKGTKDRSYRGDKDGKNKEKKKEILKKKEKRKELERYDVRKLISEKPRRKVDEFGRDISSNSRSASRSLSRNRKSPSQRRSVSRGKKRRSKSRSRSKERPKETRNARSRERGRDRSREKSWDRSKDKAAKDRSKERKSPVGRAKKKETRKERAKPARKERGRSRDKSSRERKKRKKSPSMSCSSCSCSSCEREKRRSKKLTVIVPNEEAIEEPSREKGKGKYKKRASSPKRQRRRSPVPSKEVFTSGDNILVSVNFKSSTTNETGRRKEPSMSSKRKKEEESRRKKEKTSKENQTVRSIVTAKNPNKRKLNTKNIKPIAIIDLDASPFRETLLSPKEVIILTDSDSEDKITQTENNMPALVTGPKTPPEPHIKFNIVNNKQQQLRALSNPLLDSSLEQEGDGDDEPNEIMHKGPNTPPEPPVPYDPFEPTKSRSPTPCEIIDAERDPSPTPESNQRLSSPQQLQSSKTPPKVPQHESPKTPSPLRHSPPKVADEAADKQQKQQPFQAAVMDSDDDSTGGGGGGGGGGGDSPYSPGSSEGDDLFEPPQPLNSNAGVPKPKVRLPLPTVNKYVPLPSKAPAQQSQPKKRSGKAHKENSKKGSGKKEIGIKLDEDQLKILDELPNSAVEMQVKDKFLKKLNRQERVVEEVKLVLKPHYAKKHVTKEEYKEILRKAVPKICHSRSGEINPMKIQRLIEAYVKKYRHKAKKKGSGPAIPPLRQNKSKTLWC